MSIADGGFAVTYWGATGSITAPLRPTQVTDKLVTALRALGKLSLLGEVAARADDEAALRELLEQSLPYHVRSSYGGNTTCIEIETADSVIVLDAGSGFRELGIELARRWDAPDHRGPRSAHVLITHSHMDHTFGTPFVDPFYDPRNDFSIWATQSVLDSLNAVLGPTSALAGTYFPPDFDFMGAVRRLEPIEPGRDFKLGTTRVRTYLLDHPGGSLAYRFERNGRAVVFAHDHEHQQVPDVELARFARGADLLYIDAQYLLEEYEGRVGIMGEAPRSRRGWGHSWVEACVATAALSDVPRLHLGHREPKRDDADLHRVERHAMELMRKTLVAAGRSPDACHVLVPHEELRVEL